MDNIDYTLEQRIKDKADSKRIQDDYFSDNFKLTPDDLNSLSKEDYQLFTDIFKDRL